MINHPKVAIVILNWNGRNFLQQFLPSLLKTEWPGFELVIADNGSTDDSVAFVRVNYPQVRLIEFDQNFGFAKGYNEALKLITADYFAIINSDVQVKPGWLFPLVDILEKDKSHAACQPKLLAFKNKKQFEYAGGSGGWLDAYGYPFTRGRIFEIAEEDTGQYDDIARVFWTTGAAMVIRSSVFHEMKGFDEYFFAHQEEIDLCWRMQLAGYKLFVNPASVVYHVGGGTLPRGNSLKTYLNFRNNHIMMYKNLSGLQKFLKIPVRIFLDAISAWKGLFSGDPGYFLAILRAHLAFVKWFLFKQQKSVFPEKKGGTLAGHYSGNLVWQHFVKKKKYFHEVIK